MKRVRYAVALLALLTMSVPALARSHYSMGPAQRFNPTTGDQAGLIGFSNGFVIDTRAGEPALPEDLKIDESSAAEQYYIVQFSGPIDQSWVRQLSHEGISVFGYLPDHAMLAKLSQAQKSLAAARPFVRWIGLFQPAYKLEEKLLNAEGMTRIVLLLMPDEPVAAVENTIVELGGAVQEIMTSTFGTTVTAVVDGRDIAAIARLPEVLWIQEWTEGSFCNNTSQWVMQSGYLAASPPDTSMGARPVWRNGVRGQRVILSTTDTGLNTGHDMFRDPAMSITPPGIWPDHRKVVAYKRYGGADASEGQYHGSHVAGTVCGDDSVTGGTSYYDGMARDARYYFVDVTNGTSFLVPTDHTPMWDTVYAGRGLPDSLRPIKQHSGSWRWSSNSGTYLIQDASTDAFGYAHPDFMNIMAAGNEGSRATSIGNPSLAKNVLTIGATERGTASNTRATFSSRGPAQDNRIKPNVMAPGANIWSADRTGANTYQALSGTSMATPTANGTVGLMRCYLQEGYYPTGTPEPGNRISYVSSALLRSMAMASADPNVGASPVPNYDIGWGRIDADSVLYFTGDARKLMLVDDTLGLATGEFKQLQFRVRSAMPLRVCLTWTDTAAAPNANPTLVNDLNLELTAPGGTRYRGNKYSSGQSQPNPSSWDSLNVEECARVNAPDTGLWTIWVGAQNVATARKQSFAWTMTGDIAPVEVEHDAGVAAIIAPVGAVDSGELVVPQAVVQNLGAGPETFDVLFAIDAAYADTATVTLAAGAADTVSFAGWTAEPIGWHQSTAQTLLAGDENPANDVMSDSFEVSPLTGIENGNELPRRFSLIRNGPNPFGARTAIRYELPRSVEVMVSVYSAAGQLVKTLVAARQRAGYYSVVWNGLGQSGVRVSRGIYYLRMQAGDFAGSEKLVKTE